MKHIATIALGLVILLPAARQLVLAADNPTDEPQLESIVVTAQRRAENIQDIPISVVALSGAELTSRGITSSTDLQLVVPGLVYNSFVGTNEPYLRGIGTDLSQPNTNASVATYIDGVYISSPYGPIVNLMGIERTEVLSGPQGTLYGRNATGGAINLYTLTPGPTVDANLTGNFGNYDRKEGSGHLSGPITDTLSVGIYFAATERNTYLRRIEVGPHIDEPNNETTYGFRVKAVWKPSEIFTLTATADDVQIVSFEGTAIQQKYPNSIGTLFGGIVDTDRYYVTSDAPAYNRVTQRGATVRGDLDIAWADVVSISSIRDTNNRNANEVDASTADVVAGGGYIPTSQWSEELQLLSPKTSAVQWIGGLYYFHEHSGFDPTSTFSAVTFGPLITRMSNFIFVDTDSYAAFGQATVPLNFISDSLRLTVGGRYTIDDKHLLPSNTTAYSGPTDYDPNPSDYTVVTNTDYPGRSASWKQFTPKVALDYRIGGTLLYATFSEGYKSGAFNIIGGGAGAAAAPVSPEKLTAYEIGNKSDFLNGKARVNAAVYLYNFKDLQVQTIQQFAGGGTGLLLENAGSAKFYGLDVSLGYAVSTDLSLNIGGTYEHGRYGYFPSYSGNLPAPVDFTSAAINVTGNTAERTPEYTYTASANYRHKLGSGASIVGDATWYDNAGYYWSPQNDYRQPAYHLVNASIGYASLNDRWSITAWATNLTNTFYEETWNVTGVGILAQDAPPRMYGLRFSVSY